MSDRWEREMMRQERDAEEAAFQAVFCRECETRKKDPTRGDGLCGTCGPFFDAPVDEQPYRCSGCGETFTEDRCFCEACRCAGFARRERELRRRLRYRYRR